MEGRAHQLEYPGFLLPLGKLGPTFVSLPACTVASFQVALPLPSCLTSCRELLACPAHALPSEVFPTPLPSPSTKLLSFHGLLWPPILALRSWQAVTCSPELPDAQYGTKLSL
jgi:hypothetical protein